MEPITGMLILVGLFYASRGAVRAARTASAGGGSKPPAARSGKPRSRRYKGPAWAGGRGHTGTSWWASEVGHGFPVTRAGFQQGWRAHQTAMMAYRERGATVTATYAEARREHIRRMTEAQLRASRAAGGMIDARPPRVRPPKPPRRHGQLKRAAGRVLAARPPDTGPAGTPPPLPADTVGQTARDRERELDRLWFMGDASTPSEGTLRALGVPVPPDSRHPAGGTMPAPQPNCTDPECPYCHADSQTAAPNGQRQTGGTMSATTGDTTYDTAHATLASIRQHIDIAVNGTAVGDAEQLADALPAMTPDDAETVGHVAEAVAHLQAAQREQQAAAEAAEAARTSLTRNFGDANEAVQASGHEAERGFHGG